MWTKKLIARDRSFAVKAAFSSEAQLVVLIGPSGSGKTLTLKSVAGLVKPDSGRIVLKDRVLYDSAAGVNLLARDRRIGYVFQDFALLPHLIVAQNVGFGLKRTCRWGLTGRDRIRVEEYLDIFEISHLARSLPADLSDGKRQRVALARALIMKPDLLLLDEPFAALDTLLRERLRKELLYILERLSIPIILITHDPEDLGTFEQTVVTYEAGSVCGVRHPALEGRALELKRSGSLDACFNRLSPAHGLFESKIPI